MYSVRGRGGEASCLHVEVSGERKEKGARETETRWKEERARERGYRRGEGSAVLPRKGKQISSISNLFCLHAFLALVQGRINNKKEETKIYACFPFKPS